MTARRDRGNGASTKAQAVFTALVANGFDFFERSASELVKEQKFSIAHFATGLELLLKARLFHEHWTLIAAEPHKCAWTNLKDGTVRTIQASDICAAITSTTGTALTSERLAFKAVFDHRNRVLHWAPDSDLTSTVAEQCLAWHHLHALLTTSWTDVFGPFRKRIDRVERVLREQRTYLEVRFHQVEPKLKAADNARLLVNCPACEFRAGVASSDPGRVLPYECQVCGYSATVFRTAGDTLEHRSRSEILDDLDPRPELRPKDMSMYVPDRGCCGECFDGDATVAPDGDHYVCVNCGARFEPAGWSTCERCNEKWFGRDNEHSFYLGCDHCRHCD